VLGAWGVGALMENFADAPVSITEARSNKLNDARLCTPRDILVEMLREIDSGASSPQIMMIVYRTKPDENERTVVNRKAAGPATWTEFLGLAARLQFIMNDEDQR